MEIGIEAIYRVCQSTVEVACNNRTLDPVNSQASVDLRIYLDGSIDSGARAYPNMEIMRRIAAIASLFCLCEIKIY